MLNNLLNGIIEGMERLGKKLEHLVSTMLDGLLKFVERMKNWVTQVYSRVVEYLRLFIPALGRLLVVVTKLILFYVPGIILILIGIGTSSITYVIAGVIWILTITAIGLAYGKRT